MKCIRTDNSTIQYVVIVNPPKLTISCQKGTGTYARRVFIAIGAVIGMRLRTTARISFGASEKAGLKSRGIMNGRITIIGPAPLEKTDPMLYFLIQLSCQEAVSPGIWLRDILHQPQGLDAGLGEY